MDLGLYEIIDISPVIHPGIAVFPGDTPFKEEWISEHRKGDSLTLSKIECTVHLGAHTDAPIHYTGKGKSIESRALNYYLGKAQVIEVPQCRGRRLVPSDLAGKMLRAPRVLFKTGSFPDPYRWTSDFASLSAELVAHLASSGVKLVGIDTPSIDPADDKILESHQAVFRHDMAILEGVILEKVPEGLYQLIALPLPIRGADATPVRAVLLAERESA